MNKMKCFLSKKMLLAVAVLLSVGYVQAQEGKDTLQLTLDKALEIALSENPTMKVAGQAIQLKTEAKKTIQIGLQRFIGQYSSEYGLIMAGSVISLIPVLIEIGKAHV